MNTERDRIVRQALVHYRDWIELNERDTDLAPLAEMFICEYAIRYADNPAIQELWRDYAETMGFNETGA